MSTAGRFSGGGRFGTITSDSAWQSAAIVAYSATRVWVVAPSGGSNSNSGKSPLSPFATIAKGVGSSSSGDVILLLAGTHVVSGTVHQKTGTSIIGMGMDQTIVQGNAALLLGGIFAPASGVTISMSNLTIQQTLTTDYGACIGSTNDGLIMTLTNIRLICGTDGFYLEPSGSLPMTITCTNLEVTGTWDWLHISDSSNTGQVTFSAARFNVLIDGASGFQDTAESTGIGVSGNQIINLTGGILWARNGPSVTRTIAAAGAQTSSSGPTINLINTTIESQGSVGTILDIWADGAGTNINLHNCIYNAGKTSATNAATINVV